MTASATTSPPPRDPAAVLEAVRREPFARRMGLRCLEIGPGFCRVALTVTDDMANLYGCAHGGAIFSLVDEAFQANATKGGVVALALNVAITYVSPAKPGEELVAEARETTTTRRTATYQITVTRGGGEPVALAQALAYRTGGTHFLTPE